MEKDTTKFKGGVLIIGSLIWENSELRDRWRSENLDIKNQIKIELPIRYGRISQSRNCTYTMVFSSDCKTKLGQGIFVPFKQDLTVEQIIEQGKSMIEAEHNREVKFNRFNWSWGCLGLLTNPQIEFDIEKFWKAKYGNGFNPDEYKIKDENPIILKNGKFDFEWPQELNDYTFVIGTATKPNIDAYPSPNKIAEKIVVNEYDKYFKKNREFNITTFQDEDIELKIKELKTK